MPNIELRILKEELDTMLLGLTYRYNDLFLDLYSVHKLMNLFFDECFRSKILETNKSGYYQTASFMKSQISNLKLMSHSDTLTGRKIS